MTKLWGLMALRLANADLLPLDYHPYALAIGQFLDSLERETSSPELKELLAPARGATGRLERAAAEMSRRTERALTLPATDEEMEHINRALMQGERAFLDPAGIPGRPWYRHQIYAPKFTYAAEPLPAVAEALAGGDAAQVRQQVARLVAALERVRSAISAN
jgi:N-acetylated-alpha-linked acidic dipeptidase